MLLDSAILDLDTDSCAHARTHALRCYESVLGPRLWHDLCLAAGIHVVAIRQVVQVKRRTGFCCIYSPFSTRPSSTYRLDRAAVRLVSILQFLLRIDTVSVLACRG